MFDCVRPVRVGGGVTFVVDRDVSLVGNGQITLDGNQATRVLSIQEGVTAELDGFTITGGSGLDGIAVENLGTLTLSDTEIIENTGEAGPFSDRPSALVNRGTLTMIRSILSDNNFSGRFTTDNLPAVLFNAGTATITESTFSSNIAVAIVNEGRLTVTRTNVVSNYGGLHNEGFGTVLANSLLDSLGPAIRNTGTLGVVDTTVARNQSGPEPAVTNEGDLTVVNSTISDNSASGAGVRNTGTLEFVSSTIAEDVANSGTATLRGSILDADCNGGMTSLGYNVSTGSCDLLQPSDDEVATEVLGLAPLFEYGGFSETRALSPTSAAIDKIPIEECNDADGSPLTADQRGVARPSGSGCDAGAFEFESPVTTELKPIR